MDANTERSPQEAERHEWEIAFRVARKLREADALEDTVARMRSFLPPGVVEGAQEKVESLIAEAEETALKIHKRVPAKKERDMTIMCMHVTHAICKSRIQEVEHLKVLAEEEGWSKEQLNSAEEEEGKFATKMTVYGVNLCQAALRFMKK